MLKIEHLTKLYGEKKAVDDLSLHIRPGEIYGFIGHNGAGKTTTIKSCAGILQFEQGEITIDGKSVKAAPLGCKQRLAYIPDNPDLYEFLSGIKYLNFVADIFGVSKADREARIEKYADLFDLTGDLAQPISAYSHGMKQKLAIISALLHDPKLINKDEPYVGLDPTAAYQDKGIKREHCARGGALYLVGSNYNASGTSLFEGNRAESSEGSAQGGAMYADNAYSTNINAQTFRGNSAEGAAAGCGLDTPEVSLTVNYLADNSAERTLILAVGLSTGDGGRDVESVVAAFQMVFDAGGQRCGVIFGGQRIAFGGHARQDFVVRRDEGVAAVRRVEVDQFALAAANPLRSAETFEVRQADVGQDAVVRLGDRCQQSQFAAGARAHLHHAELRVAGHGEQRQRHADVVVEVAAGGVDLEPLGQHAADKLFRGGFAVAARDGEDRDSERPAVAAGKVLQGFQRVVDEHDALPLVGSGDLRSVGDGVGRAFFERFGDETVAVEGIAPQGEEDGVRLDPARVGRDTGVLAEKFV